ncbi:MBL fold metallo-hydrolase [Nocardia pneumoniae]|uniref:MBL fold metallo-hydrolase n=1 Tax=Nocardia pneumoniae TaxID=228601 RepID=UPI000685AA40|nr:MBL fold metallo-hydrolase [Nocardia pneumoniae]
MKITHYGHACVLAEIPTPEGSVRILIDPGTYSRDFGQLREIDLVLITHAHPDHLDMARVPELLEHNPRALLVHSPGTTSVLAGLTPSTRVVEPGDKLTVRGVDIIVTGGAHACVHPDLPGSDNNGYLVAGSLLHPGDAFDQPPGNVDVLLLPVGGPWMKIGEGIDYLRAVAPRVAIPIHQGGLALAHQRMHYQLLEKLAPEQTEIMVLEPESTFDFRHSKESHA